MRGGPFLVQSNAVRSQSELIICGGHSEHRWRIGWHGIILEPFRGGIDGGDECRPAIRLIMEGNRGSDGSASGKADDADAVGRNSPFGGMLADIGDRS